MNDDITKLLEQELSKVSNIDTKKELFELLEDIKSNSGEENSAGQKIETIVNTFIREVKRLKSNTINKKKIIKLILELEINDLETVKQIYNLSGHPFDYEDEVLSDIYDETLRLFINEELYSEPLENTYGVIHDVNQSNFEKYKICFLLTLEFLVFKNKKLRYKQKTNKKAIEDKKYQELIDKIFVELYFSDAIDCEEHESNLFDVVDNYTNFETIYLEYENSLCKSTKKYVQLRQLQMIILLGILELIYKPKFKSSNIIRTTLNNAKNNYIHQALINIINYDDDISFNMVLSDYEQMYLNEDEEKNHQTFINYFTEVIISLKDLLKEIDELNKYPELEKLSNQYIINYVTKYKKLIDKSARK